MPEDNSGEAEGPEIGALRMLCKLQKSCSRGKGCPIESCGRERSEALIACADEEKEEEGDRSL
ncbi:MAG: hypothetical protein ACOX9R_08510 [Armatimonadota bacterium]